MNQTPTPQEYFAWIEPCEQKRAEMIKTIKLLMAPRTKSKSIVIIKMGQS